VKSAILEIFMSIGEIAILSCVGVLFAYVWISVLRGASTKGG
jgi:predicted nucleotidyltransferase